MKYERINSFLTSVVRVHWTEIYLPKKSYKRNGYGLVSILFVSKTKMTIKR